MNCELDGLVVSELHLQVAASGPSTTPHISSNWRTTLGVGNDAPQLPPEDTQPVLLDTVKPQWHPLTAHKPGIVLTSPFNPQYIVPVPLVCLGCVSNYLSE